MPFLVLWCASCAPPLLRLPSGPGDTALDAGAVVADATRACRAVSTLTAEIAVSGSVGGRRLRARLLAGVAAPSSVRLEAVAPFGSPFFVFVATNGEATLLLPRDNRVLERGNPKDVLEAVAGVPIDAAELDQMLTGCASGLDLRQATRVGDDWRVVPDGMSDLYVHREMPGGTWRIVAALHREPGGPGWRAEYRGFPTGPAADGVPRTVRLTSGDRKRFDLRLALSQVELNATLDADVFRVQVPASARPIALPELRGAGPLGR